MNRQLNRQQRRVLVVGMSLAVMLGLVLGMRGVAWAETFTVTNTNDSGASSLRAERPLCDLSYD